MPWDAELPGKWEPKEMTSDYKTPFDIPGTVQALPGPSMSRNLRALKVRSGSNMEELFKNKQSNKSNQEGTNQMSRLRESDPAMADTLVNTMENMAAFATSI